MGARCTFGSAGSTAGCGGVTGSTGEGGAGVAVGVAALAGAMGALISTLVVDGIVCVTGGAAGGADVMVTWVGRADGGTSVMRGCAGSLVIASSTIVGFSPCSSSFFSSSVAMSFRTRLAVCLVSDESL